MIHLLITDDHKIIRDGIKALLKGIKDISIVGEAENGLKTIELARSLKPDVILMDISMPVMNGIECAAILKKNNPEIKILVLSMSKEEEHIRKMLESGAMGYILKNTGKEELLLAIKTVAMGKYYFSNDVTDSLMKEILNPVQALKDSPIKIELTDREREIMKLISHEYTNSEIAGKLSISVRTVDAHRRNILEKTGCRNTAGLVRYAIENGLI
jgi:DNA-binding NarL/FixJ family response regulator